MAIAWCLAVSTKRRIKFSALVVIVIAIVSLLIVSWGHKASYEIEKTIRYGFLVENTTAEYIESASFQVFAPVKQNSYQLTVDISANLPFELETDDFGNQSLIFKLENIAPLSSTVISITALLKVATSSQPMASSSIEDYLLPEQNVEADSPEIKLLAQDIRSTGGGAAAISDWLEKNMVDIGYVEEDRGALYAITNKKGDCTEFSTAFVALARASEIPSRAVGGFVLEQSGRLQAENYHNWSEFEHDDAWQIADPQNNIVDSGYGSYIAFYNFNKHSRMKNSHRFLSYDPRLNVQML